MYKFIIFCLGIMVGPQLLQIVTATIDSTVCVAALHHNPDHHIILKNSCACSFQYFHRLDLSQGCTVLILSLWSLEGFSFTVWWNANPPPCVILLAVEQRCPDLPLTCWLFGGHCHVHQSLELFCCIVLSFLTKTGAAAKVFVRCSVKSCQVLFCFVFFPINYVCPLWSNTQLIFLE